MVKCCKILIAFWTEHTHFIKYRLNCRAIKLFFYFGKKNVRMEKKDLLIFYRKNDSSKYLKELKMDSINSEFFCK